MAQQYKPLTLIIPGQKTKTGVPVWAASDGTCYQGQPPQYQVNPLGMAMKTARGIPYRKVDPNKV